MEAPEAVASEADQEAEDSAVADSGADIAREDLVDRTEADSITDRIFTDRCSSASIDRITDTVTVAADVSVDFSASL